MRQFTVAAVKQGVPVATVPVFTERGWLNEAYNETRRLFPQYNDCTLIVVSSPER